MLPMGQLSNADEVGHALCYVDFHMQHLYLLPFRCMPDAEELYSSLPRQWTNATALACPLCDHSDQVGPVTLAH